MTLQVANNAQTTLAANISNVATAMTAVDASRFPAASVASGNYYYATILNGTGISEVVKVIDRTGNVLTMVRGVDGTTALVWTASGTSIGIFPVAGIINDLLASDAAILATIATKADSAVLSTLPRSAEYLVATGTSAAYSITPTNPITSYIAGQAYEVQFPAICVDNPTVAVSGLSAKNIVVLADDGSFPNAAARDILIGSVSTLEAIDVGSGIIKFLLKDPAVLHSNLMSISANTAFTIANAFGRVIKSTGSTALQHSLPAFSTWPLEGVFELISENISMQVARQNAGDVIDYYGVNLATNGITGAFIDVPAGTQLKFIKTATSWQITALRYQPVLQNYSTGLTLSTAGASTTMTIAAGQASNSTNSFTMSLASAIAKTTASWAVGNANGGLDTGTIAASTWYYWYLIRRPDTGVVDVVFSLSSAAPILPSNYTQYRYIGATLTNGSTQWAKFIQSGQDFYWDVIVQDVNTAAQSTTAINYTLTVPRLVVKAHLQVNVQNTNNSAGVRVFNPALSDAALTTSGSYLNSLHMTHTNIGVARLTISQDVVTNSSAQVRAVASEAEVAFQIGTIGWFDPNIRL